MKRIKEAARRYKLARLELESLRTQRQSLENAWFDTRKQLDELDRQIDAGERCVGEYVHALIDAAEELEINV